MKMDIIWLVCHGECVEPEEKTITHIMAIQRDSDTAVRHKTIRSSCLGYDIAYRAQKRRERSCLFMSIITIVVEARVRRLPSGTS